MSAWNWLDWTLVGIVAVSVVTAALKGFFRELIALATVAAAVMIAALQYRWAARWFEDLTRSHAIALAAGFLALFAGTLLLGAAVAAVVNRLIKTAGLEPFDRFLGGIFGLVRGVSVDCVLLMVLVAFAIKPQAVERSVLAPCVAAGARIVVWAMPRDLKGQFHSGFAKFRNALIEQDKKTAKP
jgi:membrane protein required for colicin V production